MTKGWVRIEAGRASTGSARDSGRFVLENDWQVEPGEVLVLFGPSGAGKTMTLRSIAGLVTPQDGHIEVGGRVVFDRAFGTDLPPHHRRTGYLPQEWRLFPHMDVARNVGYGLGSPSTGSGRSMSKPQRSERVRELLAMVRLEGMEKRRVWELSGGQQQRVALARALATQPAVLLLDEPFSALDLDTRRSVRNEVRAILRESRLPVLLVTHDREEALALGDRLQVIDAGHRIAVGEPLSLLGAPPRERVAQVMGVENLLRLRVQETRPQDGLMRCGPRTLRPFDGQFDKLTTPLRTPQAQDGNFELWAPLVDAVQGDEVTVALRADDVMLASQQPQGLSARNILQGRVEQVEQVGAVCGATLDCAGVRVRANLSRGAVRELGVEPGAQVWVVIKSSSCVVVRE